MPSILNTQFAVTNLLPVFLKQNEVSCSVEGTSNTVSMNAVCFGDVSYGQVIVSDTNTYGVPDRPEIYDFKQTQRCFTMQWKQISAGGYHSCGITIKDSSERNQLICWGLQDDGQITVMYPGAPANLPKGRALHVLIFFCQFQLIIRFSERHFCDCCCLTAFALVLTYKYDTHTYQ